MPQSPQRPYVPHRTPTRGQPALPSADFMLSKPFVPDADQIRSAIVDASMTFSNEEATMPPIESFLAVNRPNPSPAPTVDVMDEELEEAPDELPPLEHFLDPMPSISEFSIGGSEAPEAAGGDFPDSMVVAPSRDAASESDWVATDWQRYDWQSAAALGETEKAQVEASNAWATTDWEISPPRRSDRGTSPADAIASALDQIAERIRKGDLAMPGTGGVADPATIAATLAALLGVRR